MSNRKSRPNIVIPGAAKCGTTSLYHYLLGHPEVYLPKQYKELAYYVPDAMGPVRTQAQYDELYSGSATYGKKAFIDISTAYLYPKEVPSRIFNDLGGNVRIAIFLREPAEMAFSLWKQMMRTGNETLNFAQALAAERERMLDEHFGREIKGWPNNYFYRARAAYYEQVKRYVDVFGRDKVRVFLYERFFSPSMPEWKQLLQFLEVDENYRPRTFGMHNPGGSTKYEWLRHMIEEPSLVKRLFKRCIPSDKRVAILHWVYKLNTKQYQPSPADQDALSRLRGEFADDIKRLGHLIGENLADIWDCSKASSMGVQ